MKVKIIISTLVLTSVATSINAAVCRHEPGSVACGTGVVGRLSGHGMVTVNGTTVKGATVISGALNAAKTRFASLIVNGSAFLTQCVVNENAEIKGSLKASSSKFAQSLDVFSNSIRLVNSKVCENMRVHHTESGIQEVFLENQSEVHGDILFEDGHGKVHLQGHSKMFGAVVGGELINDYKSGLPCTNYS